MKKNRLALAALIFMFLLNACGGDASAASLSTDKIISEAYTAVAMTSMAQVQMTQTAVMPPSASKPSLQSQPEAPLPQPTVAPLLTKAPAGGDQSAADSAVPCDNSAYIKDLNIPDGTIFEPGETFTKTWKVKNTGACAWNTFYAVAFSSGDSMSGKTTPLHKPIRPNETGNISVDLSAPYLPGSYTGYWTIINSDGTAFGNPFYVQIIVEADEPPTDE